MRYLFRLFLFLLCSFPSVLFSQQNNFKTYNAKNGLPVSTIFAIAHDSRNYLWIGTEGGGISRFDGSEFRTYTTKDGLAGNQVRSILEDSRGNLWIGTENGISVNNGYEFRTIRDELGLTESSVIDLLEDRKGNIWAATNNDGLRRISGFGTDSLLIESYTTEDGLSGNFVFDIYEDEIGRLWLAIAGGLDILIPDEDTFSIYNLGPTLVNSNLITTSIFQDRNGALWIGTMRSGVIKMVKHNNLDSLEITVYDNSSGLNDNQVWDIIEDQFGEIWIATNEGGINLLSEDGIKYLTKEQGLPSNQIYRLLQDREKNIWIGTYGSGLSKFLGNHFSHYMLDERSGKYNISCVKVDIHNNLWLGTFGSGLIKMSMLQDEAEFEFLTKENGLAENDITAIAIDSDENIWISYATKGIGKITPSGTDHYTLEDEMIISNFVNCLMFDSIENLWIGTSGGITIYSGGNIINLDKSNGLTSNIIQTFLEDRYGDIWIGTLNGLMKISPLDLTTYDEEEGLNDQMINALTEDYKGNIWIGTFGGGVYKFDRSVQDRKPIRNIATDSIISSNNIFSLIFQNDSTLIVGTEKGFDKIFLDAEQRVISVKGYDESNGFFGIENNLNAICKDTNGSFWFGTAFGLTRYTPTQEYSNLQPPKTYITGMRIRYEERDWKKSQYDLFPWLNLPVDPVLKWSENHITLMYSGVSLSNPEKIRYRYRLIGLNEDWSPSTQDKEVIYQNLEPGQYEFQVIAENENGIWIKTPASYSFAIKPPLWKQWWFYVIIILILLATAIMFIRNREKQLVRKNRELELKVKERTREISDQKEEIEAQRDEIKIQRDEIEMQRDLVVSQNKEITDSIYYAQRIQRAVLPHDNYMRVIMPDYFVIYKPRDIVSGDFYWVKVVKNHLIIVAADCTGHGVPGAFMSMLGITLLNEHIDESTIYNPSEILNLLRKKVKDIMTQEGKMEEQKDGMDMALTIYDNDSQKLQFSGAYNPLYLFRSKRDNLDRKLESALSIENESYILYEFKGNRQPIGIHSIETDFTTHTIKLEPQDTFYIFSDGFVDQFGGEKRKKFKTLNFKKLLLSLQGETLSKQKQEIEKTFESWRGDYEQIDDICIVGVKV